MRVTEAEISELAHFLGFSKFAFIQRFTRLAQARRGLALQEKPNGECIFLNGQDCAVQPVKPQQCRDFPNLWNFPGFQQVCRAVPLPVSEDEYARRMAAGAGHPVDHG